MKRFMRAPALLATLFSLLVIQPDNARAASAAREMLLLPRLARFGFQPACYMSARTRPRAGISLGTRFMNFRKLRLELQGARGLDWTAQNRRLFATRNGQRAVTRVRRQCRKIWNEMRKQPNTPNQPGSKPTPRPTSAPRVTPTPRVTPIPTVPPRLPAVPELARWESQMREYGRRNCQALQNGTGGYDAALLNTYYDAEWVFYQIGDYTRDSSWYNCARAAEAVYRDQYTAASNGGVPGYWIFTHGLLEDYMRTGDSASRNALVLLARNAAFAVDGTPLSYTASVDQSREVAYTIMAYLNAELVGEPRRARLNDMVNQALDHMNQWFVHRNAPYIRPFMVALTSHALISYHEQVGGRDVLTPIKRGLDWLWNNTWLPGSEAFMYTDRQVDSGGKEPAPDLNLLIAPIYAWVYHQTGEDIYRQRADQIFAGGVKQAYLVNGKQFNQNYRLSFAYLKWRNSPPLR